MKLPRLDARHRVELVEVAAIGIQDLLLRCSMSAVMSALLKLRRVWAMTSSSTNGADIS